MQWWPDISGTQSMLIVSVISGPRRSGKTTIMHQVIQRLIESGEDPGRILYAQLDHPGLEDDIGSIIREFRKGNRIPVKERTFHFFDEAQYDPDWARWAKTSYDMNDASAARPVPKSSSTMPTPA